MDDYFKENGLDWQNCVGMTQPCSKRNGDACTVSVKTINFIKNNAVNSRCFAKLCEGLEADHLHLLYHSEVRWLSRTGLQAFV